MLLTAKKHSTILSNSDLFRENIFGYRDLSVDVDMTAATLKTRISFDCEETMKEKDGVKPDPVLEPLIKILAENQVAKNEDEFKSEFEKDKKFRPFGKKLSEYATKSGETGEDEVYEIYACEGSESGFKEYHERMQPWILFYIDAASYIDFDDANWRFFVVYERFRDPDGGEARYAFAGYTTVYQYYAYPANIRPRVSQMLVLPPFQRRGLGAKMLDVVQQYYWGNEKVIDITGESTLNVFATHTSCSHSFQLRIPPMISSVFVTSSTARIVPPSMHFLHKICTKDTALQW